MDWRLPDTRGWALLGLYVLTAYILGLITVHPELTNNTLFIALATLIVGSGGLLNALGFYFGSSQTTAKKDEAIATMAATAQQATPLPEQKTTVETVPAPEKQP